MKLKINTFHRILFVNYQYLRVSFRRNSTIFALSTAPGKSGIAIVRVSGPNALSSLKLMSNIEKERMPISRSLFFTSIIHPNTSEVIDRAMAVWMPGPHTFTGEDCCEFHIHGGPAVIEGVLEALNSFTDNRMAQAGEFTKRAFLNGKMDLTAVEGLSDLLEAETATQRRLALRQTHGQLKNLYEKWRSELLKMTANLEAFIDFGEEHFLEPTLPEQVRSDVENLCFVIKRHLKDSRSGERLRSGVRVVLIGEPNVGKSTLLNIICQRPAAIVTPLAGTTRDALDVHVSLHGYPVLMTDTAGLTNTEDIVEKEGVKRAKQKCLEADIVVLLVDALKNNSIYALKASLSHYLDDIMCERCEEKPKIIVLANKIDLSNEHLQIDRMKYGDSDVSIFHTSCLTPTGIPQFLNRLGSIVEKLCQRSLVGSPTFTQLRHRQLIQEAYFNLEEFSNYYDIDLVISAQKLRSALYCVAKLTGTVSIEEVFDSIFSNFCIGK